MSTLALIPARAAGSTGVPGVNLLDVAGKPLVLWTIEAALAAEADLDVVVSTDDALIAGIALAAGARVPFLRPRELTADEIPIEPVVLHALAELAAAGQRPDAVLLLEPTAPVRLAGTIDRAVAQFSGSRADSMVGVVPQAPFLWREATMAFADYDVAHRPRRQDLAAEPRLYRETGSLYLTRTELYEQVGNRLGGHIELFVMEELEGIDIDTPMDLELARLALRRLAASNGAGVRAAGTVDGAGQ
jgi:N-acylneuraminate cytidylyltransferase